MDRVRGFLIWAIKGSGRRSKIKNRHIYRRKRYLRFVELLTFKVALVGLPSQLCVKNIITLIIVVLIAKTILLCLFKHETVLYTDFY